MSLVSNIKTLTEFKNICHVSGLDLIDELLKGSPMRAPTFKKALEYLDRVKPSVLIETGTSRGRFDINLPSICGDGASTLIFALWCSRNNAKIYTVDIDQVCIDNCKLNIGALGLTDYVEFIVSDSVDFLDKCPLTNLKFLFLDSYDFDYNDPIPSQMHHLKEYMVVKNKLNASCCILIDDCGLPHGGKGFFVEKQLVNDNFKLIQGGYQHLYEK
jgi:hypothetical protein